MEEAIPDASLREFLRRLVADWASLLSGGLSVPATFLSYFFENKIAKTTFAALAICLFVFAAYSLWAGERKRLLAFRTSVGESLPETAPQASLRSETAPDLGPVNRLLLRNISRQENIYNIVFQPVRHPSGIHIIWQPETLDVLPAGGTLTIAPQAFVVNDGLAEVYSGLSRLRGLLQGWRAAPQCDIGPIAFSCEDGRQNRYLVTFSASINLNGNVLNVHDLDRHRIGGRPAIR